MKQIVIIVATLLCFYAGIAQSTSVTISCVGGASCLNPDPQINTTYTFNEANLPSGYVFSIADWIPTGESSTGTDGGKFFDVTWPNTPNSSIKKLKVTVRFTKTGSSDIVVTSPEVTITVKHIAAIPSITISGSGGVSGTFSNNATVAVPCGSRNLTLTAAIPFTDPNSNVVFEWLVPSGWGGSSSTNTINLTAPAGSTDQTVTLRYRRTDSNNFIQFFDLNMDRPQAGTPSFTLGSLNCLGNSQSITATAANATSFSWAATGSLSVSPTTGATTTATVVSNGSGTITATADNACQAPQSLTSNATFGTSTIYNIQPPQTSGVTYINGNTILSVQSNNACGYHWRIFGGSGYINPTVGSCSVTHGSTTYNKTNTCYASTSTFVRVELSSANSCGVGQTHTYYLQNGSGFRMTSSNPAINNVSLEFTDALIAERVKSVEFIKDGDLRTARLFKPGIGGQLATFRENRTVSFDVSNLTRGKYYLHIVYEDGKKFSETILLQ